MLFLWKLAIVSCWKGKEVWGRTPSSGGVGQPRVQEFHLVSDKKVAKHDMVRYITVSFTYGVFDSLSLCEIRTFFFLRARSNVSNLVTTAASQDVATTTFPLYPRWYNCWHILLDKLILREQIFGEIFVLINLVYCFV